jgi:DMSO/TMAO reductase YedYZ molybdopterin-dependent catalytic subunit
MRWGIDHPGITSTNPKISIETYTLTVDGDVEHPVTLSWADVLKLPKSVSVSDFHCVESWSVLDCCWEGVKIADVEAVVKPKPLLRRSRCSVPMVTQRRFT